MTSPEREEFFKWLDKCPVDMSILKDDYGMTTVEFTYDEEDEEI